MNKTTKIASLIAGVGVLAALLAGCTPQGDNSAVNTPAPTQTTSAVPTAVAGSNVGVSNPTGAPTSDEFFTQFPLTGLPADAVHFGISDTVPSVGPAVMTPDGKYVSCPDGYGALGIENSTPVTAESPYISYTAWGCVPQSEMPNDPSTIHFGN